MKLILILTLCIISLNQSLFANELNSEIQSAATLTFENDIFTGTDGGYTNGLIYSWGYGVANDFSDLGAPNWISSIANELYIGKQLGDKAVTYTVFQGMQTPQDISIEELQTDDLPYAGALGWLGMLHSWDDYQTDELGLLVSIIGPASLAEQTQRVVHQITGSDKPLGWDNQLENELAFMIISRHKWRLMNWGNESEFDLIGFTDINAGTFASGLGGGFIFRFGENLSQTHMTASLLPGRDVNPLSGLMDGYYFYLGVQGEYVFNDIFVDGNTFENSHSLPLEHERYSFGAGVAWNWGGWGFLLSLSEASSPTTISDKRGKFGSLSVSYRF